MFRAGAVAGGKSACLASEALVPLLKTKQKTRCGGPHLQSQNLAGKIGESEFRVIFGYNSWSEANLRNLKSCLKRKKDCWVFFWGGLVLRGPGEMAQWSMCLLHKCENYSSDP